MGEPKKNSTSDKLSSTPTPLSTLKLTLTQRTPSPSATTSCPPGLKRNTKNSSDTEPQRTSSKPSQPCSHSKLSQSPKIGEPSELLTQSRTKHNAVHAGLSQLLAPWKELNLSKMVPFTPSLNKSSSPAIPPPTDVEVDGKPTVWNTLPLTVKLPRLPTHTPQERETVDYAHKREPQSLSSLRSTTSRNGLLKVSLLLLLKDQFPLPLKLTPRPSKVTPVVS